MATLDDFVKTHPELQGKAPLVEETAPDSICLPTVILGVSADELVFAHLGQRFHVVRADVIAVSEITEPMHNAFGTGAPAMLTLRNTAVLRTQGQILAHELLATIPYAIARPSQARHAHPAVQEATEQQWLASRGLAIPPETLQLLTTSCNSACNGVIDDTKTDDSPIYFDRRPGY